MTAKLSFGRESLLS